MNKIKKILSLLVCLALCAVLMTGMLPAAHANYEDVEQAQYSVVRVFCSTSQGTGFAVGKAGEPVSYIITNYHVVEDRKSESDVYVTITDIYGGLGAKLVYSDPTVDFAVLKLDTPMSERMPIKLRSPEKIHKAQDVYCIGFPGVSDAHNANPNYPSRIENLTITKGSVSNPQYNARGVMSILSDAQSNPGNSGGPMVDDSGCAIGINTMLISAEQAKSWMTVAISIDYIMDSLDTLGIEYINADGDSGSGGEGEAQPKDKESEPEKGDSVKKKLGRISTKTIAIAACGLVVAIAAIVIIVLVIKGKKAAAKAKKAQQATSMQIGTPNVGPGNFSAAAAGGGVGRVTVECVRGPLTGKRVSGNVITVGRSTSCNLAFPSDVHGVSRMHCEISLSDRGIVVKDLGSSYGTILPNKSKIPTGGSTVIQSGDVIYLGSDKIAVRVSAQR